MLCECYLRSWQSQFFEQCSFAKIVPYVFGRLKLDVDALFCVVALLDC